MVIYIYGSSSFRNDIHDVIEHANIKFRLDEHGEIKELFTLEELKDAIKQDPNNIYLIDEEKIIKKNSLNQKISFLRPKDGIEQEFLLDHGIGDVSVDSIEELAKHIIKRLESVVKDDEQEIEESIIDIVEDAYEQENSENSSENKNELDEELSLLLSPNLNEEETLSKVELIDESFEGEKNENLLEEDEKIDEDLSLEKITQENDETFCSSFDFSQDLGEFDMNETKEDEEELEGDPKFNEDDFFSKDLIEETKSFQKEAETKEENNKLEEQEEIVQIEVDKPEQGNSMADDFSEFDTLNESEILEALNNLGEVNISNLPQSNDETVKTEVSSNNESLSISSSNVNDISELITKLLNNKTLEITIKVKD